MTRGAAGRRADLALPDARCLAMVIGVGRDWSGRIGGVEVARDRPLACTMTIAGVPDLPDLADVAIAERRRTQTVRIRRTAPLRIVRLVRVGGSRPGLVIHAAMADLLLSFDEPRDRDRFLEARG